MDESRRFTITLPESAKRLDLLLAKLLKTEELSRSAIQRLMARGLVTVNGLHAKPSSEAREGQVVVVEVPPVPSFQVVPVDFPLPILFEDELCLVVNKPSGLVTHPAKGHWNDTVVNILVGKGLPLSRGYAEGRPGIVHRLDRETSGVLLIAKTDEAQADLSAQFKARSVEKRYEALVWGDPGRERFEVEAPIGRDAGNRKKMAVKSSGRSAKTLFTVVETLPHISRVEARPFTGRTHQIRVHLCHVHHPVVGDRVYGGRQEKGLPSERLRRAVREAGRFFLHASSLSFTTRASGSVTVEAPLPEEFTTLMEVFRTHG